MRSTLFLFTVAAFGAVSVLAQWDPNPWFPGGGGGRGDWDQDSKDWAAWERDKIQRRPIYVRLDDFRVVLGHSLYVNRTKRINQFLGIPYARDPVYDRRFKAPEDPYWGRGVSEWNATYYRPACPQELWHFQDMFLEYKNTSEDCLYLNVFTPNRTDLPETRRIFPVVIFINGDSWTYGSAEQFPGDILASRGNVVVVTFNYRLGALGFLTTESDYARGNYGLLDQLKVLKWVRDNIAKFQGDPKKVTLMGGGSGAASVGMHLVSPMSKGLFHQAIMHSGSDLCEWSTVSREWKPREYAKYLAEVLGCPFEDQKLMVECIQKFRTWEEVVNATSLVWPKRGASSGPFAPVVDGRFLPATPTELREAGQFMKVRVLMGVTKDDGAYIVQNVTRGYNMDLDEGMEPEKFKDFLHKFLNFRYDQIKNTWEVLGAMEFEYTYWAAPRNRTAVVQNFIDFYSDYMYGWCMDTALKYHTAHNRTYMYVYSYRTERDFLPRWMGAPHGHDLKFVFGYPFINETLSNVTGIIPLVEDYTDLDRNISDFMITMWSNFIKYGYTMRFDYNNEAVLRNITWYPYIPYNLTYLDIAMNSSMQVHYRQNHYSFWRDYYPKIGARDRITTTPRPTLPPLIEYQVATGVLSSFGIILILIMAALGITFWRRGRES